MSITTAIKRHRDRRLMVPILFILITMVTALSGCYSEPYKPRYPNRIYQRPTTPGSSTSPGYTSPTTPSSTFGRVHIGPRVIIVDPGHGGKDPGAQGVSNLPEKSINLSIGRALADMLAARGARVIITRRNDRYVELDDRAAMAEQYHADLFVSIHADSNGKSSIEGATLLVGRTASTQSKNAARKIQAALERSGIHCRGMRSQQLRVLEGHSRPAVLVECGFLTNPTESQNLNSGWYRSKVAAAIADGISDYFN